MGGVRFETAGAVSGRAPDRADVACFVGRVHRRVLPGGDDPVEPAYTPLPPPVERWLRENGWSGPPPFGRPDAQVQALLDVPVPCENWETFDQLFAWERRPYRGGALGGTYLAAAVRSFFAQGGRLCYVVRVGDPWAPGATRDARLATLPELIPGWGASRRAEPAARRSWRGMGLLFGLPDVSFVALPDLAEACAPDPSPHRAVPEPPPPEEVFVECSAGESAPSPDRHPPLVRAPRCDEAGYRYWGEAVRAAADIVRRHAREVQLVAALPIPADDLQAPGGSDTFYVRGPVDAQAYAAALSEQQAGSYFARDSLLRFLTDGGWLRESIGEGPPSIASAFVQLTYPWLRTPGSQLLPEGLEGPEGALTGLLARNALLRGTYFSAAALPLADILEVHPVVTRDQLDHPLHDLGGDSGPDRTLAQRVSLIGPTPRGIRLLSDVTTSRDESHRPASVNRLVAAVIRAARRLGEEMTFEASGERTWRRVEERLGDLLLGLLREGALRGATPADAFHVRCDRSTMTQNDVDEGRVIAQVTLQPAAPVEEIVVVLSMTDGGRVERVQAREAA
jgi:hypothetical protein